MPMFQFYLSSIKSIAQIGNAVSSGMFQFYLSSIKSQINNEFNASEACFNSTLVQLKEWNH